MITIVLPLHVDILRDSNPNEFDTTVNNLERETDLYEIIGTLNQVCNRNQSCPKNY